jgi:hypothetical protein
MSYLTLPLALPALLAIFFRFFCHSGLVNSRSPSIDSAQQAEEVFLFYSGQHGECGAFVAAVHLTLYYGHHSFTPELLLKIVACMPLKASMDSDELDRLLKDYLEAKFDLVLDYFVIEGRMAPDASGDMGVTGSYRKEAGDKNVFFTVTVNVASRKIQNLQEY